jgi:type I restriction enzyme S subunit
MRSNWKMTTLGAVTTWLSGGTPKKEVQEYWGGAIPWISANSMYGTRFSDSEVRLTQAGLSAGSRLAPTNSILL